MRGQFGYREFERTQASAQRSRDEVPAHFPNPSLVHKLLGQEHHYIWSSLSS